ncbi:alpha/beta hydrolase fold domain-containing protein [Zunongwangia sp. H14]|uniref:alpha/beta hydrolase fold domain-containing protein n=1 Tax=Zunongwangia sp. H14 TaxID=3240792 RepID=UPI00356447F2
MKYSRPLCTKKQLLLLFSLQLFLHFSCSTEEIDQKEELQNDDPKKALVLKDISYGEDPAQTYDLYLPVNRSKITTKVLVFIHGGGWIQGDKADMQTYIPLLQQKHPAYAIANLNYRLARPNNRAAFPNQFQDVKKALKHIEKDGAELGIKAEFGLIGVSSGGHIALQFDSVYDDEDLVKMVCSIVGPTNFTDPYYIENADFLLALDALVNEDAYPANTDYAKTVSPAYRVNTHNSPSILFYGKDDPLVPISNGEFLKQKLDASQVPNELTIFEGGHGDWEDKDNESMQNKLGEFIEKYLPIEQAF